jgi:hypothetical protein
MRGAATRLGKALRGSGARAEDRASPSMRRGMTRAPRSTNPAPASALSSAVGVILVPDEADA